MDEEDTYKMLRGLTEEEAIEMHTTVWTEMYNELELDPNRVDAGIPIGVVRERLDPLLKPYGWSYDRLLRLLIGNNDFS